MLAKCEIKWFEVNSLFYLTEKISRDAELFYWEVVFTGLVTEFKQIHPTHTQLAARQPHAQRQQRQRWKVYFRLIIFFVPLIFSRLGELKRCAAIHRSV